MEKRKAGDPESRKPGGIADVSTIALATVEVWNLSLTPFSFLFLSGDH